MDRDAGTPPQGGRKGDAAPPRPGPSTRLLATAAVLGPVLLVAALLLLLTRSTSERVADELTRSLVGESVARVAEQTRGFLARAERLATTYRNRIHAGRLPAEPRNPATPPIAGSTRCSKTSTPPPPSLKEHFDLRQSLDLAMRVQQSLLPQKMTAVPGLDVAGGSTYCDQTGGDYFDFLEVAPGEGDRLLIAVGDEMGHGIPVALLMATARAALRAGASTEVNLGTLMRQVNAVLSRDAEHDPTILLEPAPGAPSVAAAPSFVELERGDIPRGMMDDAVYEQYIRTDGIWEASVNGSDSAQARDLFGKDRLRTIIAASAAKPAAKIAADLENALREFRGGTSFDDDVTDVILKVGCYVDNPPPMWITGA